MAYNLLAMNIFLYSINCHVEIGEMSLHLYLSFGYCFYFHDKTKSKKQVDLKGK